MDSQEQPPQHERSSSNSTQINQPFLQRMIEKYSLGPRNISTIYENQSAFHKRFMLVSYASIVVKFLIVLVTVAFNWSGNVLCWTGLWYCSLLLFTLVMCPLYFVPAVEHHEIPDLMEQERIKDNFKSMVDTLYVFPFVTIVFIYFGGSTDVLYRESPWLYTTGYVFVIMGFTYIFSNAIIAILTILCLPCLYILARFLNEREQVRIRSLGASEELITAFPILKFRKKDPSPDIEASTGSIGLEPVSSPPIESPPVVEQPIITAPPPKKKRLFKFSFKKAKTASMPEPLPKPEFLEVDPSHSVCAICLTEYEEGEELRQLTCSHHFHVNCIDEWLRVNAKCPLCTCKLK